MGRGSRSSRKRKLEQKVVLNQMIWDAECSKYIKQEEVEVLKSELLTTPTPYVSPKDHREERLRKIREEKRDHRSKQRDARRKQRQLEKNEQRRQAVSKKNPPVPQRTGKHDLAQRDYFPFGEQQKKRLVPSKQLIVVTDPFHRLREQLTAIGENEIDVEFLDEEPQDQRFEPANGYGSDAPN